MHCTSRWAHAVVFTALAVLLGGASSAMAQSNSSTNSASITFSLNSVVFTVGGAPVDSADYGLDDDPSDFFNLINSFVYTEGDGTGSFGGSVTLGGVTHNHGEADPDYSTVLLSDNMVIALNTMGESMTPGSNGSAAVENSIGLPFFNNTDDGFGDPAAITITFDYSYVFNMSLIEGAGSGQANGFYTISAFAYLNESPNLDLGDIVEENYAGPANLVAVPGSGQIVFNIPAGEQFFDLELTANLNSTTLVPLPEPAAFSLLALGGLALVRRRR